jgi:hypothetical protein
MWSWSSEWLVKMRRGSETEIGGKRRDGWRERI